MLMRVDTFTALSFGVIGIIFGLIFGSAINAIVWRLHVGRSWAKGRSECPDCGHVLHSKDLIPVVSWALLGGKCRYCRKPIKDHPIVELLTAGVFGLSAYVLAPVTPLDSLRLVLWLVLAVMLIVLAVYDAKWMLLPDKIMYPLIVVGLLFTGIMAFASGNMHGLFSAVVAAGVAGGGFFAIVFLTKGRAMGGGDIKLAAAMGLILGAEGTAVAMLVAFNVAAVVGLVMIISRLKARSDQIPFGPYLVGGTIIAFLYGRDIVAWYLKINGI